MTIRPTNTWTDDPKYGPQQIIPDGLEKPCGYSGSLRDWDDTRCSGTMRLVEGTDHWDADGHAQINTTRDRCGMQSCAYWYWPTGRCPAEDPDYGEQ